MNKLNISLKDILIQIINRSPQLSKSYNNNYPNKKYSLSLIIDEIFYVLKTGIAWRDIKSIIKWQTLYWHYKKFVKFNIFRKLFTNIKKNYLKKISSTTFIIDSSFIANKNGSYLVSRNKFYKNKTGSKISLITDIFGIPLSILINKGSVHDLSFTDKHIKDIKLIIQNNTNYIMLADKAYESKKLRQNLEKYNIQLMVQKKKKSNANYPYNKQLYKKRITIENTFQKLKIFRRICTRYDKLLSSYTSFVFFGLAIIIYNYL